MSNRITFKRVARTGRYRSFQPDGSEIKRNKNAVGWITEAENGAGFRIYFHVKSASDKSGFTNKSIKARPQTLSEAKAWVSKHIDAVLATNGWELHEIAP